MQFYMDDTSLEKKNYNLHPPCSSNHLLACEPEMSVFAGDPLPVGRREIPAKFLWTGKDKDTRCCYIMIISTHAFFLYFNFYFIMQYSQKYLKS